MTYRNLSRKSQNIYNHTAYNELAADNAGYRGIEVGWGLETWKQNINLLLPALRLPFPLSCNKRIDNKL